MELDILAIVNQKYGFGLHPGFKFSIFILINIFAFSPDFIYLRWILLPLELLLGYIVHIKWFEMKGFFKVLMLNFIGLFLLFYAAELNLMIALMQFLNYTFTIIVMFLAAFIFVHMTPPRELLSFFEMLKVPKSFSVGLMVAIAFLPLLNIKIREIIRFQQARGYQFRIFNLIPLIIPGILGVLELAMNIAISMEARGFQL
jgi:energy-coupling factor transporter transmembrane protein EcfT